MSLPFPPHLHFQKILANILKHSTINFGVFFLPPPFIVRGSEVLGFTFLPTTVERNFALRFGSPRSRCWHSYWQHPKSSRLGSALGGHQTFRRLIFGWEIGTAVVSIRCLMYQISLVPHFGAMSISLQVYISCSLRLSMVLSLPLLIPTAYLLIYLSTVPIKMRS